jgi:rare lipoprotein A (peptidoglycan hydrolase)
MGTTVVVRNVANGASVTCVVTDREASNPGRIIDLDTSVFSAIAPLSAGTVSVTVSW